MHFHSFIQIDIVFTVKKNNTLKSVTDVSNISSYSEFENEISAVCFDMHASSIV